ncbi:hypothetical protein DFH09DRAFT_1290985, partial [Mycena vulgaris]
MTVPKSSGVDDQACKMRGHCLPHHLVASRHHSARRRRRAASPVPTKNSATDARSRVRVTQASRGTCGVYGSRSALPLRRAGGACSCLLRAGRAQLEEGADPFFGDSCIIRFFARCASTGSLAISIYIRRRGRGMIGLRMRVPGREEERAQGRGGGVWTGAWSGLGRGREPLRKSDFTCSGASLRCSRLRAIRSCKDRGHRMKLTQAWAALPAPVARRVRDASSVSRDARILNKRIWRP